MPRVGCGGSLSTGVWKLYKKVSVRGLLAEGDFRPFTPRKLNPQKGYIEYIKAKALLIPYGYQKRKRNDTFKLFQPPALKASVLLTTARP